MIYPLINTNEPEYLFWSTTCLQVVELTSIRQTCLQESSKEEGEVGGGATNSDRDLSSSR
jgi:hypothetical protein